MRESENIRQVAACGPDWMGFIFYPDSRRFVGEDFIMPRLPQALKRVGVFVNEPLESVRVKVQKLRLDYVQLHGDETPGYLRELKEMGANIVKVFRIENTLDVELMRPFEPYSDFFLFDTQAKGYGGSGQKFDWQLLNDYSLSTPFLLSGGVTIADIPAIRSIRHPALAGVDVNSKVEEKPGLKDIKQIEKLVEAWR